MSCKSALYAINNSVVSLPDGGTYAPATIVRRYGQNYQLQGNGITLTGHCNPGSIWNHSDLLH